MRKTILTMLLLCAGVMVATAQVLLDAPTLKDANLKGPIRAVLTTTVYELDNDEGYAFFKVENSNYDTAGRLVYIINSSPDGLDDVLTYNYDHLGRLATVNSRKREVYTNTYRYNDKGQLVAIETHFDGEDFERDNTTLYIVKRDRKGRPLLMEDTWTEDSIRHIYSFEYRANGKVVTRRLEPSGFEERLYFNNHDVIDSAVVSPKTKTIYTYNERGDLIESTLYGVPDYPKGMVTAYRYGEDSWLFDRYGNWTTRDVTLHDGTKGFEIRTIIYYE